MAAHDVVDHHELSPAVKRLVPSGADYLFTSYSKNQIKIYRDIMRPFGEIVAIDDERQDLYPLKSKSITWHWEFMFARPTTPPILTGRASSWMRRPVFWTRAHCGTP